MHSPAFSVAAFPDPSPKVHGMHKMEEDVSAGSVDSGFLALINDKTTSDVRCVLHWLWPIVRVHWG